MIIPARQTPMHTRIENPVIYTTPMWQRAMVRIIDIPKETILVSKPHATKAPAATIAIEIPGITCWEISKASVWRNKRPKHIRIEPRTTRKVHWRRETLALEEMPRIRRADCFTALTGRLDML